MDYSKFNDEEFDAKEWINSAFKAKKEGSVEQYASTLAMKLQMFMQEVNNVIEDGCQQAINNLPRVTKELEAVRQEASLLQEQMKMAKYDIQKVEHDTANSMQNLMMLDQVKSRMKLASDALKEADNWTTLSSDVDEVFDSQDLEAHILTNVPDYTDRCQYLEMLKNRLEAMSSTAVVAAFATLNLDDAQRYVKIFKDIERISQLCKYYHKCQKAKILKLWRDVQTKDDDDGSDDDNDRIARRRDDDDDGGGDDDDDDGTLKKKLNKFYDELLLFLQNQLKWCDQVFPENSANIVCDLLSDSLKSLDPPLDELIDRCLQSSSASAAESSSSGKKSSSSSPVDDHPDPLESTSLLSNSIPKIFSAVTQSNERCLALTNGVVYIPYLEMVKEFLRSYLKELKRVMMNIFEKFNRDVIVEDWSDFQNALKVIQLCGELIAHMDELDLLLTSCVVAVGCNSSSGNNHNNINNNSNNMSQQQLDRKKFAFKDYKSYLMDSSEERKKLEQLIDHLIQNYITNVLEDLGLQITEPLLNIKNLLQATATEYETITESCPQRVSNTIAKMRGLDGEKKVIFSR
ncbi:hypothetical protein HELRODRAFT_178406 [Helobdella robusta]|uniref:Conserved oligomeric Golgi complex subunit 7 n=1 Tax=Helobdella robusta TaxID=6412 RepID=T1FD46_HELRO|nr:hypothetical protein HELRODRAFT_178406 [Helobdella robusta]ESN97278.1 hypothetical protein HELRODRAFT_178406 [Helobdella robusta]